MSVRIPSPMAAYHWLPMRRSSHATPSSWAGDRPQALGVGVLVVLALAVSLLTSDASYAFASVVGWPLVAAQRRAALSARLTRTLFIRGSLSVVDLTAASVALWVATHAMGSAPPTLDGPAGALLLLTLAAYPLSAALAGLHPGYGVAWRTHLLRGVTAALAAGAILVTVAAAAGSALGLPLVTALVSVPLAAVLVPTARLATVWLLRQTGPWARPLVILGGGPEAREAARALRRHSLLGLSPVARFGANEDACPDHAPHLGSLAEAWAFVRGNRISHLVVCPDASAAVDQDTVLRYAQEDVREAVWLRPLTATVAADARRAAPHADSLATLIVAEAVLENHLACLSQRTLKRVMDVLGSFALLVFLAPALLAIVLAVRLDSRGPALYFSPRVGRDGRRFACIKFRTMHVDAEERLRGLLESDEALREEYSRYHKLEDDPRITRLGRLLRKTSLDELPQLLNVLVGHMSLVGPRPYLAREESEMGRERELIFLLRPGLTGYWQIDGRNDVSFEQRQRMEAAYVRRWSLPWDVTLLLRTPAVLLRRNGR